MQTRMDQLRWGIVSAGNICHDFVTALSDPTGPAAADNRVLCTKLIYPIPTMYYMWMDSYNDYWHVVTTLCCLLQVVAVAASQMDRAKTFADKHGIHTAYGDYNQLANDREIGGCIASFNLDLVDLIDIVV